MNIKRYIAGSLAVFFTFEVLNFIIHSKILSGTYQEMMNLWRPDMMSLMWVMNIASLIFSFTFMAIFVKGYEGKGILEGIRFSLVIAALMLIPGMLNQFVVYPVPLTLCIQWLIYGLIQYVACGVVAALIYRPKA